MIDTLRRHLPAARARGTVKRLGLAERAYAVVTLHRPRNVDDPSGLRGILTALQELARRIPVVFPVHPRTAERIRQTGFHADGGLQLREPLGYLDFLALMDGARFLLTDSGGIQEETTALGVPCLTLRSNTERPITIAEGTNRLLGEDPASILPAVAPILDGEAPVGRCPELWDGHASERIAAVLAGIPALSR